MTTQDLGSIEWPTTVSVLKELFGYAHHQSVIKAIKDGRLAARQPGGSGTPYLIDRESVEQALATGRITPGHVGKPPKRKKK